MATRKNILVAEQMGLDPEQVQAVLARVNPTTRAQWIYCSDQLGCDVDYLINEASKPAPEPLPLIGPAPAGQFNGIPFGTPPRPSRADGT